jgi:hypothetical protein
MPQSEIPLTLQSWETGMEATPIGAQNDLRLSAPACHFRITELQHWIDLSA